MKTITEAEAHRRFRQWLKRYPNQREAAKALNMSIAYLNDQLHGRRRMSDRILRPLGLQRVREVRFEVVE